VVDIKNRLTTSLLTANITVASVNAGTVSIEIPPTAIQNDFLPFVNIGFTFVDGNDSPVTPGAGTLTIKVKTIVNPEIAEDVINGTLINATVNPINLYFNGAPKSIEFSSGTDITTATNIIVRVVSNRTA